MIFKRAVNIKSAIIKNIGALDGNNKMRKFYFKQYETHYSLSRINRHGHIIKFYTSLDYLKLIHNDYISGTFFYHDTPENKIISQCDLWIEIKRVF